jgi:hypothetical protein
MVTARVGAFGWADLLLCLGVDKVEFLPVDECQGYRSL